MEEFLTFLSNNYIYFLIAGGVLFFALIGFIVDLKKKRDKEEEYSSMDNTPLPVQNPTMPMNDMGVMPNAFVPPINTEPVEASIPMDNTTIPVTPMPMEEPMTDTTMDQVPVEPVPPIDVTPTESAVLEPLAAEPVQDPMAAAIPNADEIEKF